MSLQTTRTSIRRILPSVESDSISQRNLYHSSVIDLEEGLTQFVRWSLKTSVSQHYSPHTSMELLERAWKAQKLLWKLRVQSCFVEDSL